MGEPEALEGRLTTENRRGEEKRRCIEQIRERLPGAHITAYGNATSDFEHLAQADEPLVVNANAATRRRAASLGLACDDWKD